MYRILKISLASILVLAILFGTLGTYYSLSNKNPLFSSSDTTEQEGSGELTPSDDLPSTFPPSDSGSILNPGNQGPSGVSFKYIPYTTVSNAVNIDGNWNEEYAIKLFTDYFISTIDYDYSIYETKLIYGVSGDGLIFNVAVNVDNELMKKYSYTIS